MIINTETRLLIARALVELRGRPGSRLIALGTDTVLEVRTQGDAAVYTLLEGADLFGDPIRTNVTATVQYVMRHNLDWLMALAEAVDRPGREV